MKITEDHLCERCKKNGAEMIENLNHLLFDCPSSVEIWKKSEEILTRLSGENLTLDKNSILFGVSSGEYIHHKAINSVIARIKHNFIQIERPTIDGWENKINFQIKEIIECEKMYDKLNSRKFNRIWSKFLQNLNIPTA